MCLLASHEAPPASASSAMNSSINLIESTLDWVRSRFLLPTEYRMAARALLWIANRPRQHKKSHAPRFLQFPQQQWRASPSPPPHSLPLTIGNRSMHDGCLLACTHVKNKFVHIIRPYTTATCYAKQVSESLVTLASRRYDDCKGSTTIRP
jgi:hypothetical protein